jgi:exonuclease VII large subunit
MKEQKRLRILGDDEIEAIYGIPRFTPDERIQYFSLSQREKELLVELRSVKSQTYFVLQLGYFKARHLFFTFDLDEVEQDMQFVLSQHFNNEKITNLSAVDKHTRLKQQRLILQLFNYRSCDAKTRQKLAAKAQQSAAVCCKPVYIFRELMHYLSEHNIVAPGYSFMQDTVGQALSFEQKRLTTIVGNHLTSYDIEVLLSGCTNTALKATKT